MRAHWSSVSSWNRDTIPGFQNPTGKFIRHALVAKSFFDHYQIDHQVSRRFEPFIEESMLCVDLTGPSVEVHGNRTGTGTPPPGTTAKNSQDGLDDPATD